MHAACFDQLHLPSPHPLSISWPPFFRARFYFDLQLKGTRQANETMAAETRGG